MIFYRYYADVPEGAVEELVQANELCRLVTSGEDFPHIGLYPFTFGSGSFALHLHRKDEQVADLRARPRCVLEVDEVLARIPSHWIDPEDGAFATAYHKTAIFECRAEIIDEADRVAELQRDLLTRYQPEGGYRAVNPEDPMYADLLRMLVGVRLSVENVKVKFKLGQNRDFDTRAVVARRLRERGTARDQRTADVLEETIRLGWTTARRPQK